MRDDACRISVVGSSHSAKSTYLIWTVAWHQLGNLGCLMTVCWIHSFSKNLHIIRGSLGSVLHACICCHNSWINWSLVLPPFQDSLNHYEDLHDYSGNHPFPIRNASGVGKACVYVYIYIYVLQDKQHVSNNRDIWYHPFQLAKNPFAIRYDSTTTF